MLPIWDSWCNPVNLFDPLGPGPVLFLSNNSVFDYFWANHWRKIFKILKQLKEWVKPRIKKHSVKKTQMRQRDPLLFGITCSINWSCSFGLFPCGVSCSFVFSHQSCHSCGGTCSFCFFGPLRRLLFLWIFGPPAAVPCSFVFFAACGGYCPFDFLGRRLRRRRMFLCSYVPLNP